MAKVVNIRFVVEDDHSAGDLINDIGNCLEYVLGAVPLVNNGFGALLPDMNEASKFADGNYSEALAKARV